MSTEFTDTLCRLQCSHAGLFQCSLTGLVFLMKGEGEVLYRTVQWEENLLHSTGQTPAGPLFSIECLQGSICQLHLPHCEILSGEGLDSLSVAHVTGDSVEVLPPLRVTDTHVVVNITDLSLWGLVRMFKPFLSIKGQVLPFLQSFGHPQSVLNVIVLPSNVPLNEAGNGLRGADGDEVLVGHVLLQGAVLMRGDQAETNQMVSAEDLRSVRTVDGVSIPVLESLLDRLLQRKVCSKLEIEKGKVILERAVKAREVIDKPIQ